MGWLIWAVILAFTGMRHPNVPQWPDIGQTRRWLAVAAVLMLLLTLVLQRPFHGAASCSEAEPYRAGPTRRSVTVRFDNFSCWPSDGNPRT